VPWELLKRPDAVVRALNEIGGPAGASRIAEVLAQHGRRDSVRLVAFALEHLQRQGRVGGGPDTYYPVPWD
jgi:repressor of nif and glnA expression